MGDMKPRVVAFIRANLRPKSGLPPIAGAPQMYRFVCDTTSPWAQYDAP
jgi:hypothetical protein